MSHKFRFLATTQQQAVVNTYSLTSLLSTCYLANSACRSIFYAVRIKSLEIWSPAPAIGTPTTATLRWSGGLFTEDVVLTDTTFNVSEPAHIRTVPPDRTAAKDWSNNDANQVLFTYTLWGGSILDIELEYAISNGSSTIVTPVASGVDGFIYALPLDKHSGGAGNNMLPQGLTYTF